MERMYKTLVEPISIPCVLFARARIGFPLPRRHSRYSAGRFNRYSSMCVCEAGYSWKPYVSSHWRHCWRKWLSPPFVICGLPNVELAAPDGRGGCQPPKWRRREKEEEGWKKKSDRSAARGNARSRLLTVVWISPVVRLCSAVVVVVVFKKEREAEHVIPWNVSVPFGSASSYTWQS